VRQEDGVTLADRADAYAQAFPKWPSSHLRLVAEQRQQVLYGTWLLGNDYRVKSQYYGGYPKGYLPRVMALFPEPHQKTLHLFSGSLPPGPYTRVDLNPDLRPDVIGDATHLTRILDVGSRVAAGYTRVFADPPYSQADADKYGTAMIDRRRVLASIAEVTRPGAHLNRDQAILEAYRRGKYAFYRIPKAQRAA
jgi:hypothetical protein